MTNGTKMTEETMTEYQKTLLGGMARCHEANVGRLPETIEELADHWYDMSDIVVVKEHIDEDGHYNPAMTVCEVDAPNHCLEWIWLRKLQKRPDADALLAEAIKISSERRALKEEKQ